MIYICVLEEKDRCLTFWGRVTHICVHKLIIVGWRHYPNQCWYIVNLTLRNKLQWNANQNSSIFIEENTFKNFVCKMLCILSRPQCVNSFKPTDVRCLDHHWFRQWPVSCLAPSHYLNQCWLDCHWGLKKQTLVKFESKCKLCPSKMQWRVC